MLQNRVTPYGEIIRSPARGRLMGNRGVIHNEKQEIVRPFRLKAWIACVLEFKGRWRKVMTPDRWTELFFADEATAFAAGHRPCFECRRSDAVRFKTAWIAGNPEYGFDGKTPIGKIDEVLHRERVAEDGSKGWDARRGAGAGRSVGADAGAAPKMRFSDEFAALPNGSFIEWEGVSWLAWDGLVYRWSPEGYGAGLAGPEGLVAVLTPRSVVNAFRAGYVPEVGLDRPNLRL